LGRHGTAESRAEYDRIVGQWIASGRRSPRSTDGVAVTSVNEVILAFWNHVQGYYRHPSGTPTSEVDNIRLALRPCKELYGHTRAADFDSIALEAVRARMIQIGRCRNRVNKDVARIKRMFRWAASKRIVSEAVCRLLDTVQGLRCGRSE